MARGVETLTHLITLFIFKNYNFRKINGTFSKRRKAKRIRVYKKGALTVINARNILAQKKIKK